LYHCEGAEALEVVAKQTAEPRVEEDHRAERRAESHCGDDDLPRSEPDDALEDRGDDQREDRGREGERRPHHCKHSLDPPTVDPLDSIRADVSSCELD
jgi:hypothetical protein